MRKCNLFKIFGIGRQWADWIIGINLTSVTTIKYKLNDGQILNIGRVLLPTLKIIYDRDKEIENFKSSAYYKLNGTFKTSKMRSLKELIMKIIQRSLKIKRF